MGCVKLIAFSLLMLALTGGSFTCRSGDKHNNDDTDVVVTGHF